MAEEEKIEIIFKDKIIIKEKIEIIHATKFGVYKSKVRIDDELNGYSTIKNFYISMKENIPYYESEASEEFDYILKMAAINLKQCEFLFYQNNTILNFNLCNYSLIKLWEEELNMEGDKNLTLSQRQNIIKARYYTIYNDFSQESLIQMVKLIGSSTFYQVIQNAGRFITIWVNLDDRMKGHLKAIIDEIKPAHLRIDIENSKKWNYAQLLGNWNDVEKNGPWNCLEH